MNNPVNFTDLYGLSIKPGGDLESLLEGFVALEKFMGPFVVGSGAIFSGAVVGGVGIMAVEAGIGLGPIGWVVVVPKGLMMIGAGGSLAWVGGTIYVNHICNLLGIDFSLPPYFPPKEE